jgi:hypothetical protein
VVVSYTPTTSRDNTLEATLRQNLTWPNLRKDVEVAVHNCHECQIVKNVRKKYGDLPEKLVEIPVA